MSNIFVKAVDGRVVFIPSSTTTVPAKGIDVEDSLFWQRRIDDGDVELSPKSNRTAANADKDNA